MLLQIQETNEIKKTKKYSGKIIFQFQYYQIINYFFCYTHNTGISYHNKLHYSLKNTLFANCGQDKQDTHK